MAKPTSLFRRFETAALNFVSRWWRPATCIGIAGGALVTVGALLWMKRRDYRATQSGYDPRAIDE